MSTGDPGGTGGQSGNEPPQTKNVSGVSLSEEVLDGEVEDPKGAVSISSRLGPEGARRSIVYVLLLMISLTVLVPYLLLAFGICLSEKYWEYLHIIFPAEIGLLATSMTFYFDRRS